MNDDNEIGKRLEDARIASGFVTATEAAESLGVKYQTYAAHENGSRGIGRNVDKYSRRFGVSIDWLLLGVGEGPKIKPTISSNITDSNNTPVPNATFAPKMESGGEPIKVYGHAVAGEFGEFVFNGSVLFEVMAPPSLLNVKNAYAVIVSGDSMSPRYEDGEIVFVDPDRRKQRGCYVIAQIQNEEDGPLLAYIKKFVSHNTKELILEQFNPQDKLKFPNQTVASVHMIVLGGEPPVV